MADAMTQNLQLANLLAALPKSLFGSSDTVERKSSGGTATSQTMLSQDALNYLMKGLMERTSGLASIAAGQKTPGLYNTTTRNLLINDLMSRSAGEVAVAAAPKVTTETPKTETATTKTGGALGSGGLTGTQMLLGAGALAASSPWVRGKVADAFDWATGGKDALDLTDVFMEQSGTDLSSLLMPSNTAALGMDQVASLTDAGGFGDFGLGMPSLSSTLNFLTGNNAGGAAGESMALSMIPGVGLPLSLMNSGFLNDIPVVGDISQNVVQPAVDVIGDIAKDVGDFITEDIPEAAGDIWDALSDFFSFDWF